MTNPRFLEQLEDRIAALEHAFNYLAERFNGTLPGTRELPDVGVPVAQPDPYAHLKECLANGGEVVGYHGSDKQFHFRMESHMPFTLPVEDYSISKPAPVKEDKPPVAQPGKDDGAEVVWTDAALVEALRSFIEQDLGRPRNVRAPVGTVIAAYNIIKEERDDLRKKLAEVERERSNEHANMTDDLAEVMNERDELRKQLSEAESTLSKERAFSQTHDAERSAQIRTMRGQADAIEGLRKLEHRTIDELRANLANAVAERDALKRKLDMV